MGMACRNFQFFLYFFRSFDVLMLLIQMGSFFILICCSNIIVGPNDLRELYLCDTMVTYNKAIDACAANLCRLLYNILVIIKNLVN